ncbi:MAG: hypothetical protein RIT27_105 [Pseudomonadota bacterium]
MIKLWVSIFLLLQTSFSFADVYPTDTFGIHKLCLSNPWNGTNFKGDATSSFPCHYDYAIVHVPTLLSEQGNQILTSKVNVKLEIDPIDYDIFFASFVDGFEFAMWSLFAVWIIGFFFRFVLDAFRNSRR